MAQRILIIAHEHPDLSLGGGGMAAYRLFHGLKQLADVEAYFLACTDEPAQRRETTPFCAHCGRPDEILFFTDSVDQFLFSQRSSSFIRHFSEFFTKLAPDVIHFHHYLGTGLELIALARQRCPGARIFVTLHEYLAICANFGQMVKTRSFAPCHRSSPHDCAACFKEIPPSEFFLRETFIKSHFEKVDLFIAPSNFLRNRYVDWGIPGWQITVIENGAPPVAPPPPRRLAEGEGRSVFGFFGRISPYKGVVQLLTAFDYLNQVPRQTAEGVRLILNGIYLELNHPQFVDKVKELLARNRHRIHFAGGYRNDELHRLMAAVDWVVVPSIWWENSPIVIDEALAHRRPVICSGIGGMAEKVRHGQDGLHFAVGNPFELASLVVQVARDRTIWDRLQGTMRQPPTIAESVARHLAAYRDRSFALAGSD